jgi:putative transposase
LLAAIGQSWINQSEDWYYPYLLRGMEIVRPNQVWAMDITDMSIGAWLRLSANCARLVQPSRAVVAHTPITMEAAFCVETLEDALAHHRKPNIFDTDQGSQFTGLAFTGVLANNGIAISMDGKRAWQDNVFVERLWRSIVRTGLSVGLQQHQRGPRFDRPLPGVRPTSTLEP